MAPWDSWTKNQKIAALGVAGVAGLYGLSRMGGGSVGASLGEPGSNMNILDVRRPTDDINAVGGRDPNAWLLREIFRDIRKDQGTPTPTPPPTPTPTPGKKAARFTPIRVAHGSVRIGDTRYRSVKGDASDNFVVNRQGKVIVRGIVGDKAWWNILNRLGFKDAPRHIAAEGDPRSPKMRVEVRPEMPAPPPNSGTPSPVKRGPRRGSA